MSKTIGLVGAALLLGSLAGCRPDAAAVAAWQARCLTTEDVAAHAARSREGVSATCHEAVLERATVLARGRAR